MASIVNEIDLTKTQVKQIQRFRHGGAPWGVFDGWLYFMNFEQTAVAFVAPMTRDRACENHVAFDRWAIDDERFKSGWHIDLDSGDITVLKGYADFPAFEHAESSSRALESYLYPWKETRHEHRIVPEGTIVMVPTLKLMAQTFEAFGVKSIMGEYCGVYQWWRGNTRDTEVVIVTMAGRRQ